MSRDRRLPFLAITLNRQSLRRILKGGGRMSSTNIKPATRQLGIQNGPAAHVIFDHVKYAYDDAVMIPVTFTLKQGLPQPGGHVMWQTVEPRIIMVGHEDGSGQSLLIEGYLNNKRFTGWYNARSREGLMDVII
jgi:hypothetical protein